MSERNIPVAEQPPAPDPGLPRSEANESSHKWLGSWRGRRFRLSEGNLFLLLAIIIGVFSGLAVVCFRITIEWIRLVFLGSALAPPPLRVLIVPALGGLVVAFLVLRFFRAARGSG